MLKISYQEKSISDEEKDALLAEGRKRTAEHEFSIIANDKKRLSNELIEVNSEIDNKKVILSEIDNEVIESKKSLKKVKSSIDLENEKLTSIKEEVNSFKNQKDKFIELQTIKEKEFNSNLLDLDNKYKEKKLELEKELIEQNNILGKVKENIEQQKLVLKNFSESQKTKQEELDTLKNNILEIEEIISFKNQEIERLDNRISVQNRLIDINKFEIDKLKLDISSKNDALNILNSNIENKTKEYKSMETKVFNFVKREQVLDEKEEYIKQKYQLAGIEY